MDKGALGFKIGFLNINGLNDQKTTDNHFQTESRKFDMLLLSETWETEETLMQLQHLYGYLYICVCTKNK